MKSYQSIGSLGFEHFEVKRTECLTMAQERKWKSTIHSRGKQFEEATCDILLRDKILSTRSANNGIPTAVAAHNFPRAMDAGEARAGARCRELMLLLAFFEIEFLVSGKFVFFVRIGSFFIEVRIPWNQRKSVTLARSS
jgi:hypothetical protein